MKLTSSDFPKLQFGLLAMLTMIALGAAAIYYTNDTLKREQIAFAAAQKERNEFDGKLRQVRSEENEIRTKAAILDALEKRGIIGAEQRLEWIELLKEIRDKRRLIELQYELSPQRALGSHQPGALDLHASAMKLQLKLLHEGDLINLLHDLQQNASALIQPRYCNVLRLQQTGASAPLAQLQAECMVDWITLNSPEKP